MDTSTATTWRSRGQAQRLTRLSLFKNYDQHESHFSSQNQVPKWMYPGQYFPPYVLGSLYIIPARLLGCLVTRTSEVGFISIEDVYVTGLLRTKCPEIELTFVPGRCVVKYR